MTFWPLREIVTELAGGSPTGLAELVAGHPDAASIVEQVTGAIGLHDRSPSPRELFPAVRRLLETLAAKQPTLIVVDDAHWAEPTLLELLDYVADAARQPLLILCLARPDFTEKRPAYHQARPESVVRLEPLSPADSERLVSERLGHRTLLPDLRARVIETAQGNPLFIEQLLAATIHDHVWPELPPAIQALLAARSSTGSAQPNATCSAALRSWGPSSRWRRWPRWFRRKQRGSSNDTCQHSSTRT